MRIFNYYFRGLKLIIYTRLRNTRNKNVKTFSTFTSRFFNLKFSVSEKNIFSVDFMKTVTSEKCNTHILYHSVKGTIPKIIIYKNLIWHYDATRKNDTENSEAIFRISHQRGSVKKFVLRNFPKFTGKHMCRSLFNNEVADSRLQLYLKIDFDASVFCEFCEILKNTSSGCFFILTFL